MLIGATEIYANHPVVLVGAMDWPEVDWADAAAAGDGRHIAVRTRGQVALTRVALWRDAMPIIGPVVFDGELDIIDHRVCIFDIENLTWWTHRVSPDGPQRVVVCVDEPMRASRVHVGFGLGAEERELTAVNGYPLQRVRVADGADLSGANELGLILDGSDRPIARLAAALMVFRSLDDGKAWRIHPVVEWLRGLGTEEGRAHELGEALRSSDEDPLAAATHVLRGLAF
jgi:hypothetical protein